MARPYPSTSSPSIWSASVPESPSSHSILPTHPAPLPKASTSASYPHSKSINGKPSSVGSIILISCYRYTCGMFCMHGMRLCRCCICISGLWCARFLLPRVASYWKPFLNLFGMGAGRASIGREHYEPYPRSPQHPSPFTELHFIPTRFPWLRSIHNRQP